jgi:hypothetical protein
MMAMAGRNTNKSSFQVTTNFSSRGGSPSDVRVEWKSLCTCQSNQQAAFQEAMPLVATLQGAEGTKIDNLAIL